MTSLRLRRHAKVVGLRCLRVVRRHHFSLCSAGVLGGALAIALTSTSFELEESSSAQGTQGSGEAAPPVTSATVSTSRAARVPRSHLVVYYVIDSEAQRNGIEMAVQADVSNQQSVAYQPATFRDFIWARTEEQESSARDFIRELAFIAQVEDYQFQVVDLR